MKQIALTIALLVSLQVLADTSVEREVKRKPRYVQVTAKYHKCVERVKRDYNPKTDDAIGMIIRCRQWAINTTD